MASSVDLDKTDSTTGDYYTVDDIIDYRATSHTLVSWFYWEGETGGDVLDNIFGSKGATDYAIMHVQYSTDKLRVFYNIERIVSTTTITTNKWYFGAITFDGGSGSGQARLYIGDIDTDATLESTSGAFDITWDHESDIAIGGYYSGASRVFKGQLAYVHVYNTNLSLEQIQEIQRKPGSITSNLLGYYPMINETDLGKDYSGNGNDLTAVNSPSASNNGPPVFFPDNKIIGA
jgi:hypothetical protein